MKRSISDKVIRFIIGIALLATMWQVLALVIGRETMILPGPIATVKEMARILGGNYVYSCILMSLRRMFTGFAISFLLALVFGIISGNNAFVRDILKPTVTALQAIPTASLVFLFIVLSGARNAPIYIVSLISFPILYEGVMSGVANVPRIVVNAARIDGADYLMMTFRIKLPLALPYIIVGIASSFSLSFKIEIMAEVITGSTRSGLGAIINAAQKADPTNMVPIFGYSLIAIIIMLAIDFITGDVKKRFQ